MAYQYDGSGISATFTAAADLSTFQHCFVKITADNTVNACTGAADLPIGVLLNKPSAAGQAAHVMMAGVTKLKCAGVINVGTTLAAETAATARATSQAAPNTKPVVGIAIDAGTANEIITAAINCLSSQPGS